jgi:hypothetical protein
MTGVGTGSECVFELCSCEDYTTRRQHGLLHVHKFLRSVLERHGCEEGKCAYALRTYRRVRATTFRDVGDADKVLVPH